MSHDSPRSQRMDAYAEAFGEPAAEVTARLRRRVRDYVNSREHRRNRRRHWLQGAGFAAVVLVGAGIWTLRAHDDDAADHGWIGGEAREQVIALRDGRELTLAPGARIRVQRDEADALAIELLDGELSLSGSESTRSTEIAVGEYRVAFAGEPVGLRHTGGVPVVTVGDGEVLLFGPSLPTTGLRLRASAR